MSKDFDKNTQITIDGFEFTINRFQFWRGQEVRAAIMQMLLPSLGQIMGQGIVAMSDKIGQKEDPAILELENHIDTDKGIRDELDFQNSGEEDDIEFIQTKDANAPKQYTKQELGDMSVSDMLSKLDPDVLAKVGIHLSRKLNYRNIKTLYLMLFKIVTHKSRPLDSQLELLHASDGLGYVTLDKLAWEVVKFNDFFGLKDKVLSKLSTQN